MPLLQLQQQTTVLLTADAASAREFFKAALGFEVAFDIGWFVSLRQPQLNSTLDLWSEQHESARVLPRGSKSGFVLAFVVAELSMAEARVLAAGGKLLQPTRDEPWGQRHVLLQGPDGVVIDLVQRIAPDPAWLAANGLPTS